MPVNLARHPIHRFKTDRQSIRHGEETMHLLGERFIGHQLAGGVELIGIGFALINQNVELRRQNNCRCNLAHIISQNGRHISIETLSRIAILVPEMCHQLGIEEKLIILRRKTFRFHAPVSDRIDQNLQIDFWAVFSHGFLRHHGRQIAARAVTGHNQGQLIRADFFAIGLDPIQRRIAILHRHRIFMLRAFAIINHHDNGIAFFGQMATDQIIIINIADNPAAAVIVNHHRLRRTFWCENAPTNLATLNANGNIFGRHAFRPRWHGTINFRKYQTHFFCTQSMQWRRFIQHHIRQ